MTATDDLLYYDRRARQERAHANTCRDNGIAQIHLNLADAYERRVRDAGGRREPNLVALR